MRSFRCLAVLLVVVAPRPSAAFSVLAHQAVVDRSWDDAIAPALRRRFGDAGREEMDRAKAFAHGGSHLADLGYFPLGSRLFTNLAHYVRAGDFVTALVDDAETRDEYAFALGALSHYVTDNTGHPEATNRVVPEVYPKLRKKYGDDVTYADDRSAHLATEFRFDVLQVAHGEGTPDLVQHAVGFEVAKPLLERAFRETYGLELDDLFANTDVAIATYRWAFRDLVHEATGIAWQLYEADIKGLDPQATPAGFVYDLSRDDFEKQFGKTYREPGYFVRFFGVLVKLVPNVGPLRRLPYKPLPEDAQQRFFAAREHAVTRYRAAVAEARGHHLRLENTVLDTGRPARRGEYEPADEAYAGLLEKLDQRGVGNVSRALRADILRFYRGSSELAQDDDSEGTRRALARLEGMSNAPRARP